MTICATCAELWQAGDGERDGEAHDEGGAAGQQVQAVFPRVRWSDPLCSVLGSLLHISLDSFVFIRSQDGAEKAELTLPASIEFRDNCKYLSPQFNSGSIDHFRWNFQRPELL